MTEQKYWTVADVEDWMAVQCSHVLPSFSPRIDLSDRVSWRWADGDIIDISVGGYLRARNKWDRPLDYRPQLPLHAGEAVS
jgi:hypothetical protein